MEMDPDLDKKDIRRPMNAFLIFCKRHRSMVREKNAHLDNRSVTRILGDLWANIGEEEKNMYTDLAKQYKDAFMKANPDYKWHNPERMSQLTAAKSNNRPTNERVPSTSTFVPGDGPIVPGKLADPSNMGGLSMLMEGVQTKTNQFSMYKEPDPYLPPEEPLVSPMEPAFYPWMPPKDFDNKAEKKSAIYDDSKTKNEDISNVGGLKIEPMHQMDSTCSDPAYSNKHSADPEDAMFSYGKVVMDHIIDKLYLSTIRNMEQNQKVTTFSISKSPHAGTKEDVKLPTMPINHSLPPLDGKKSYHTSIAVKNLLEFTRRAAARDMENWNEGYQDSEKIVKREFEETVVSETKQKLKDFCLKKEGRPKVVTGIENSGEGFDMKEFRRKRCFSESCTEMYRIQKKKVRMDKVSFEEEKSNCSSNSEDSQPTRKSRRRNRGQRYQELINEGIIQPSKARLAAMRTDTNIRSISFKETFFSRKMDDLGDEVLSVYPRQIRKRTVSESEKTRTAFEESNRYRTGDFDLEAHIKTLPACSLEKVVRTKRNVGKSSLSESECGNGENLPLPFIYSDPVPEVKLTVPPHIKAKPVNNSNPVVGSRKRKARKHSITHLMPVKDDRKPDGVATLSGTIRTVKTEIKTEKMIGHHGTVNFDASKTQITDIEEDIRKSSKLFGLDQDVKNNQNDIENYTDCNLGARNYPMKIDNANFDISEIKENSETNIFDKNVIDSRDRFSEDTVVADNLYNVKFTKLKESKVSGEGLADLNCSEESLEDSDHQSENCEPEKDSHNNTKDQDENSNEQNFCFLGEKNSTMICDGIEFNNCQNEGYDNFSSDSSENVTLAVSVSVSMAPASMCDTNNITPSETENTNIEAAVSMCDLTSSSSVTMPTLQTSLTCLC